MGFVRNKPARAKDRILVSDYTRTPPGITRHFIELEKPQFPLFKASGDPSNELSHGLRQILDWESWFIENRDYFAKNFPFREQMLKFGLFKISFLLIIGRREKITDKNRARRRQYNTAYAEIMTFDRLTDHLKDQDLVSRKPIRVCSFINGEVKIINEMILEKQ